MCSFKSIEKKIILLIKDNTLILKICAFLHNLIFINIFYKSRGGNRIITSGAFFKGTRFKIHGKGNNICIHPENKLFNCLIFIKGNQCKINIGKHCIISNTELWIEDDFGTITIGTNTTIESAHIAATEGLSIVIGDDCMFAKGIKIRNGDSHPIFDINNNHRINKAASITIYNHVWLGEDVKVLKGTTIGKNSIIGTGSILTSNVEPNSIYAGIPAKKIKDSVYWERNR